MFKYHDNDTLLSCVGKQVKYVDLFGMEKTSMLLGNGKRTWLQDAACNPYADTVLVCVD